jgi:hypothetical protein
VAAAAIYKNCAKTVNFSDFSAKPLGDRDGQIVRGNDKNYLLSFTARGRTQPRLILINKGLGAENVRMKTMTRKKAKEDAAC